MNTGAFSLTADFMVVLDKGLSKMKTGKTYAETAVKIYTSRWLSRLWTLQEAYLSILVTRFKGLCRLTVAVRQSRRSRSVAAGPPFCMGYGHGTVTCPSRVGSTVPFFLILLHPRGG